MPKLHNFPLAVLVLTLLITTLFAVAFNLFNSPIYNTAVGDQYAQLYNEANVSLAAESNRARDIEAQVRGGTRVESSGVVSVLTQGIWSAIQSIGDTMKTMSDLAAVLMNQVGVPDFLVNGVLAILLMLFGLTVLAWVFGRQD